MTSKSSKDLALLEFRYFEQRQKNFWATFFWIVWNSTISYSMVSPQLLRRPVGWGWRTHRLQMLRLLTWSIASLPLLSGLLWSGGVVSVRVPSRRQIDIFKTELRVLNRKAWNNLTVWKQISTGSFKNYIIYKLLLYKSYVFNKYVSRRFGIN